MPLVIESVQGTVAQSQKLTDGLVQQDGELSIQISAFYHEIGGTKFRFDGVTSQAITDNDTSYVYIDSSNNLQVNTTGFPADTVPHHRLATVVASGGTLTAINDQRAILLSGHDDDHGNLTGLGDDDHPQYLTRNTLTTKGDIFVSSGSGITRLPVGNDGEILAADSSIALGIKWTPSGSGGGTDHGALSGLADNDHPQYQLTSSKGQANGYAALNGSAEISDATHGSRGGGSLHSVATTSTAGFMSATDKQAVDLIFPQTVVTVSLRLRGDVNSAAGIVDAATNNNMAAAAYRDNASDGESRWAFPTPTNYVTGGINVNIFWTAAATGGGGSRKIRWEASYNFKSAGQDLGAYNTLAVSEDVSTLTIDQLRKFNIGTIPHTDISSSSDVFFFRLARINTHADDNFNADAYVHKIDLVFTGSDAANIASNW